MWVSVWLKINSDKLMLNTCYCVSVTSLMTAVVKVHVDSHGSVLVFLSMKNSEYEHQLCLQPDFFSKVVKNFTSSWLWGSLLYFVTWSFQSLNSRRWNVHLQSLNTNGSKHAWYECAPRQLSVPAWRPLSSCNSKRLH